MPGPATDVGFRTAALELRAIAVDLERATRCWPSLDPALYGSTVAHATSADRLAGGRASVSAVVSALRVEADGCDRWAQGCSAYYEAYVQYRAQRDAYASAWHAYDIARRAWATAAGPIVLGPPLPGAESPAPAVPEPAMPTIACPSEPPCPPYCDPSPVR